jgi:hypothetical protein
MLLSGKFNMGCYADQEQWWEETEFENLTLRHHAHGHLSEDSRQRRRTLSFSGLDAGVSGRDEI